MFNPAPGQCLVSSVVVVAAEVAARDHGGSMICERWNIRKEFFGGPLRGRRAAGMGRAKNLICRASLVLAVAFASALYGPAAAQRPVALVEDVNAPRALVGFMDYVVAGQVIELGAAGTLKLG